MCRYEDVGRSMLKHKPNKPRKGLQGLQYKHHQEHKDQGSTDGHETLAVVKMDSDQ